MKTPPQLRARLIRRHLVLGWGALFVFILMGLGLEIFHAFKAPLYLDVENETRRLMWKLSHAHGTLFSLMQLALAWTYTQLHPRAFPRPSEFISGCFTGALILVPGGFFLGGVQAVDGDPGLAISFVPPGALLLLLGVGRLFLASRYASGAESLSRLSSPSPGSDD